jgi:integrase
LDKWVLPNLGDRLLADVKNGALKELVEKMADAGLSPKTIHTHAQVVKIVVASAVNSEGDQIYPRKWNHDFIGLPIVEKEKQHRPTVTEAELGEILASTNERYAILFALLAGSGLRIGEALGLKRLTCRQIAACYKCGVAFGTVKNRNQKRRPPCATLI